MSLPTVLLQILYPLSPFTMIKIEDFAMVETRRCQEEDMK